MASAPDFMWRLIPSLVRPCKPAAPEIDDDKEKTKNYMNERRRRIRHKEETGNKMNMAYVVLKNVFQREDLKT